MKRFNSLRDSYKTDRVIAQKHVTQKTRLKHLCGLKGEPIEDTPPSPGEKRRRPCGKRRTRARDRSRGSQVVTGQRLIPAFIVTC